MNSSVLEGYRGSLRKERGTDLQVWDDKHFREG